MLVLSSLLRRSSKRKEPALEEDEALIDPAERTSRSLGPADRAGRRRALEQRIDTLTGKNKPKGSKKKKKKGEEEEEDLGAQQDEERLLRLRKEMDLAALTDSAARENGEVATAKLLLLPRIIETMRKCVGTPEATGLTAPGPRCTTSRSTRAS